MRKLLRFSTRQMHFGELTLYILYRICKAAGILHYSDQNQRLWQLLTEKSKPQTPNSTEMRDPLVNNYLRRVIAISQGSSCYRLSAERGSFFVTLKMAVFIRFKAACVMEAGSLTIFLCALFIFSAEGKVYKHFIHVRCQYVHAYIF